MKKKWIWHSLVLLVTFSVAPLLFAAKAMEIYSPQENVILPLGYHLMHAKGIDGSLIELENGAQFSIINSDSEEVLEWDTNTCITISPNPYWFSSSDFFITNKVTNKSVHADYIRGPSLNHLLTNLIDHIDPYSHEIYLKDNKGAITCWEVDDKDVSMIYNWEVGETVIIGSNDSWYTKWGSDCKHILISYENLSNTKYVRAQFKPQ